MAVTYQKMQAQRRNIFTIGILLTILAFILTNGKFPPTPGANAESARIVSVYVDGQKRVMTTDAKTVGDVLERLGVKLGDGDLVEPTVNTPVSQGLLNVNVYRARPVLVVDGLHKYHIVSAHQSARLLAQDAGLTVFPEDTFSTQIVTDFVTNRTIGDEVDIDRAIPIVIHVDGVTDSIRTQGATVAEAIKGASVVLGPNDTVSLPLDTPITPGLRVSVTRVSEVVTTLTEILPRPVQTVIDPNLAKGLTSVKVEGSDGQKVTTYRIHYLDGRETRRDVIKLLSQTAPVARVVVVGTKVTFEGSVEYWRPMVVAAATQWGIDPNMMLRIMQCESNGNAADISHFVVNGQHPMGLFQYLTTTWVAAGGTPDNILDGPTQIQLTAKKMALYGTSPWACR